MFFKLELDTDTINARYHVYFGLEDKCYVCLCLICNNKKSILTTNRMNPVDLKGKKKVKNQEKFEVMGKGF